MHSTECHLADIVRLYAERGLYETVGRPSVCPSVPPIVLPPHAAAAGLLLWARWAEDVDQLLHTGRSAANASMSRCRLTQEAEYRLVCRPLYVVHCHLQDMSFVWMSSRLAYA